MSTEAEEDADLRARVGGVVGGKWRLDALLGSGGMAAVYRARGPNDQHAAVKILHPEMARKKDVRERFIREAYVANKVGHPGAVAVVEHSDSPEAYLVMELLDGEPLASRVKRQGMSEAELLGVLDQVLDVLAVAHSQGIIHRDIKPDNLFLCNDGRVEVLDFGLARMIDELPGDFKTRTGLALGTVPYMPPEQALGRRAELDGRADLFALGASAFRILSGRRVHEAPSEAELLMAMATQPVPSLASIAPQVSPYVSAIIDLSLAFSRDARYPDAKTMQGDVRAARAGQVPPFAVGQGVQTSRDAPTRVDMVAPVPSSRVVAPGLAATGAGMQPSLETAGPASVGAQSAAWPGAAPPHSVADPAVGPGHETPAPASVRHGVDAPPASASPHSLQYGGVGPQSAYDSVPPASAAYPGYETPPASLQYGAATTQPSTPPPKKRGGLLLLFLFGIIGVVGLLGVGAAYAFYEYGADALEGEQLPPSAVGVSPMTTAIDPTSSAAAPAEAPSDTSKATASSPAPAASTESTDAAGSSATAPQPAAAAAAPKAKPQAAAPTTPPAPAPKAAPATSPKPAATATNMVMPPAVAPPASKPEKKKKEKKEKKEKGNGKGRGKGPPK